MSLTQRIVSAMVLGLLIGGSMNLLFAGEILAQGLETWITKYLIDGLFDTVGQIFVNSLKLMVVPLVFVSLLCGMASLGGGSRMGLLAGKTLCLYLFTTAVAISLALSFALILGPGNDINLAEASEFAASEAPPFKTTLINIFPSNPVAAMAEGQVLQVIVFALLIGLASSKSGDAGRRLLNFFDDLNKVIMETVMLLMVLAPYGIFCLLVKLFASLGFGVIVSLASYFFTVLLALAAHGVGTYSLLLLSTGLSPWRFFVKMRGPMAFAFSTSSSGATMPVTLKTVNEDLGVDNRVASFTVPLGATINMDGTAIMQGVATVFIAQAYNINLGIEAYLTVILTATLASIGTAAVPGVGLVMLVMVLNQVGLPVEGIGLIIGVDRMLDMCRTAVNVAGDGTVSTLVAHSEGFHDREKFDATNL